jgi:hypothetical protein
MTRYLLVFDSCGLVFVVRQEYENKCYSFHNVVFFSLKRFFPRDFNPSIQLQNNYHQERELLYKQLIRPEERERKC